jgi:hypothetical protein
VVLLAVLVKKKKANNENAESGKADTAAKSDNRKEDSKNAPEAEGMELTLVTASQNGYLPTESVQDQNKTFNDSFL